MKDQKATTTNQMTDEQAQTRKSAIKARKSDAGQYTYTLECDPEKKEHQTRSGAWMEFLD